MLRIIGNFVDSVRIIGVNLAIYDAHNCNM